MRFRTRHDGFEATLGRPYKANFGALVGTPADWARLPKLQPRGNRQEKTGHKVQILVGVCLQRGMDYAVGNFRASLIVCLWHR